MHRAPGPHIQVRPPLRPQAFQHFNVSLKNGISLGENRYSTVDAFFTQQMQGGIRRAVGAIGNVVCLRASKLELGVEKSHLQDTVKLQFFNQIIGQRREVIEIQEVFHARRRDQQRRIALFGRDRVQRQELAPQIAQQRLRICRRADHVMHLPFDVHAFGKRA